MVRDHKPIQGFNLPELLFNLNRLKSYNLLYSDEPALAIFANEHAKELSQASDILITIYSSELDIKRNEEILNQVKRIFPKAKIAGATTSGEIDGKRVRTNEILIAFHFFSATKLIAHHIPIQPVEKMLSELVSLVKDNSKGILLFPVVVSEYFDIELFLELLYGNLPSIPIFGGAAAEYGTITKQYCFLNNQVCDNGISIVLFQSDSLHIETDYSFNWMPVGQKFTITKVENNIVKTIDNKPAAQVVFDNLGEDAKALFPGLGLEFPFVFKRKGVLMARVIIGFDNDNVILAAPVEVGTNFQFSFGSRKNAIDYSLKMSDRYASKNIESIMAFSCIARLNFLKSDSQKELYHLPERANISGFFTYGEIYHSDKSNYYLNETLTLAFFSENPERNGKDEKILRSVDEQSERGSSEDSRLKILTHLVSKVTLELEKKNDELNHQNETLVKYSKLIDDRNMEIGQSLRYASKLQNSIVFQEDEFSNVFEDHFIFFRPKEQVSGDFYFIRDLNDKIILAVADGTGHGVPGAFISILGVQIMDSITRRMKIGREELNAGDFLNSLREKMIKVLDRNRISKFSTDGLDISLIIIDKKTRKVDFSGANQCMIIYTESEMIQLKGDRMPIGAFVQEDSFSNTSITLEAGSKVFMFTDGFADQFGGKDAKKINSHMLRSIIKKNGNLPLSQVEKKFQSYFDEWKADREQTDDVLLLGFKL